MTSMYSDMIQNLYSTTLTPRTGADYLSDTIIRSVLDLIKKAKAPNGYQDVSDDEIDETIEFILALVNAPVNLVGMLAVKHGILYLVDSALTEMGVGNDRKHEFEAVLTTWFDLLEKAPPNQRKLFEKKPHVEALPLMAFHAQAYSTSLPQKNSPGSLYAAYAYMLHEAIRLNEKQGISPETHKAYVRSARYFFEYTPLKTKALPSHPEQIPDEYIKDFVSEYNKSRLGIRNTLKPVGKEDAEAPLAQMAKEYERIFRALIAERKISSKPNQTRRTSNIVEDFSPPDGNIVILEPGYPTSEPTPAIEYASLPFENPEERDECSDYEFVPDEDHEFVDLDADEEFVPKKPVLRRDWLDFVNLRAFHFYWDSNVLNLFHYSVLYNRMDHLWGHSSYYNAIIAYLYILINTGMDVASLLNLVSVPDGLPEDTFELKKIGSRYYLLNPTIVKIKNDEVRPECCRTSPFVHVPVPEAINGMIGLILDGKYVFSYRTEDDKLIRLNRIDIEEFLAKEINQAYAQYHLKITPAKISRSFFALYSHRYGLDPLICCHISGKDHHSLYTAPMHYVHIPHQMLEDQYLSAFAQVDSSIRKNLDISVNEGFLMELVTKRPDPERTEKKAQEVSLAGYGSTIVCDEAYSIEVVSRLKAAVLREKDFVRRHNLYVIYAYLALQFSTGLRPRNHPELKWQHYDADTGIILIRDKQSAKYHEERMLPLPDMTQAVLNKMKQGFKKMREYVAINISPAALTETPGRIFYFIEKEGEFSGFTLKAMKEYLKQAEIIIPLPANFPRHYMRNYLYHAGISNDIADIIMGHQHAGKEMLNITSSTIMNDTMAVSLPVLEDMLKKIGFEEIRYIP